LPVGILRLEVILFQACFFLPLIALFAVSSIYQRIKLEEGLEYLI
jgi:hypothetical protein